VRLIGNTLSDLRSAPGRPAVPPLCVGGQPGYCMTKSVM